MALYPYCTLVAQLSQWDQKQCFDGMAVRTSEDRWFVGELSARAIARALRYECPIIDRSERIISVPQCNNQHAVDAQDLIRRVFNSPQKQIFITSREDRIKTLPPSSEIVPRKWFLCHTFSKSTYWPLTPPGCSISCILACLTASCFAAFVNTCA